MAVSSKSQEGNDVFPWHIGVFDAHCHPTDTMGFIDTIPSMRTKALTIMATRSQDQHLVDEVAREQNLTSTDEFDSSSGTASRKLVPSFGWHPWFSHQLIDDRDEPLTGTISAQRKREHYNAVLKPSPVQDDYLDQLPNPKSLSQYLAETRRRLEEYPNALLGEVGLDKTFRLPKAWPSDHSKSRDEGLTPGGREGRELSPYRVQPEHQVAILAAQLRLAGELQRACSVHGVRATGLLHDTLKGTWRGHEIEVLSNAEKKRRASVTDAHSHEKLEPAAVRTTTGSSGPFPPRICLHSYSGDPAFLRQYFHKSVPVRFFASYSTAINFGAQSSPWAEESIKLTPDDRVLIESDMHIAGEDMDRALESIARKVCGIKKWSLEHGVAQLAENWRKFAFG